MRKSVLAVLILAVVMAFGAALAYAEETTVKGELIDVGCHAKKGEKGMGTEHAACAMKCASQGGAMGILAGDTVYEIASNAVTGDNSAKISKLAGKSVEAKGEVEEKDGKKVITLTSIKPVKAEKEKKPS